MIVLYVICHLIVIKQNKRVSKNFGYFHLFMKINFRWLYFPLEHLTFCWMKYINYNHWLFHFNRFLTILYFNNFFFRLNSKFWISKIYFFYLEFMMDGFRSCNDGFFDKMGFSWIFIIVIFGLLFWMFVILLLILFWLFDNFLCEFRALWFC
jgi:hypothetical protein